jgi:hypothetical protein
MSTTSLELSRGYASFSGVDIRVVIEGAALGTLQAISYAIQREKAPIYVMGSADPLSFSRGKRGIAGTIVTLMLDRHLLDQVSFDHMQFVTSNASLYANVVGNSLNSTAGNVIETVGGANTPSEQIFNANDIGSNYQAHKPWYVDQIPPFDACVLAQNEYGNSAQMRIFGIEILNEGSGFSIDDIVIENQMTYVARTILPWQPLGRWQFDPGGVGPGSLQQGVNNRV